MLPSFPSIRERNLRTLYGDGGGVDDRSPKGSVDVKIRPLVDLINQHPDYVTLSSCSGRVALFDPTAGGVGTSTGDCICAENTINLHQNDDANNDYDEGGSDAVNNGTASDKSTNSSGKGNGGKWIFVTHDILPDLGSQIIHSLKQAGHERSMPAAHSKIDARTTASSTVASSKSSMLPITFKHEPPLLHVAASNLESGMRLLRVIKSAPSCAMRESGLVVTDKRVTVEIRTTATMLTLPIMIKRPSQWSAFCNKEEVEVTKDDVILVPDEEYLMSLSEIANERMIHNEALLEGLFSVIQRELFGEAVKDTNNGACEAIHSASATKSVGSVDNNFRLNEEEIQDNEGISDNCVKYVVKLQSSLPPLNLWKTAAVVLPSNNSLSNFDGKDEMDLDVLVFGGQGVGPIIQNQCHCAVSSVDGCTENCSIQVSKTCKRWDAVFRLSRQSGVWSKQWDVLPTICAKDNYVSKSYEETTDLIHTAAGIFRLTSSKEGMGPREGHTACVIPRFAQPVRLDEDTPPDAVIVFGGRISGGGQGMSPTNDLFLYVTDPLFYSSLSRKDTTLDNTKDNTRQASKGGLFGRPLDVSGTAPEPRYGHTMILLPNKTFVSNDAIPFAVVAGGTGMSSGVEGTDESSFLCLNSIYTLACTVEEELCGNNCRTSRSHLMWNRIADMPSPRSFHTSVIYGNRMFVFGGYSEADDPFSFGLQSSWCTVPLDFESTSVTEHLDNKTFAIIADKVPLRIGSSAVTLDLKSNTMVLIVGGASTSSASHYSDHHDEGYDPPIILIAPNDRQHHCDGELVGRKELVRAQFEFEPATEDAMDFGSCVHHCLVALPQRHDDSRTAVIVGGGVPSFSFGQSYGR